MRSLRGHIRKRFTYRYASHVHLRKSDHRYPGDRAAGEDSDVSCVCAPPFLYSLCIIISSYAKKANKIPVKLHKCNKFFISQTVTCHRSQTFGHNNTPPCRCSPISNLHDSCRWVFCLACLRFQRPCIPGRPAARCQNFPKSRTKNVG